MPECLAWCAKCAANLLPFSRGCRGIPRRNCFETMRPRFLFPRRGKNPVGRQRKNTPVPSDAVLETLSSLFYFRIIRVSSCQQFAWFNRYFSLLLLRHFYFSCIFPRYFVDEIEILEREKWFLLCTLSHKSIQIIENFYIHIVYDKTFWSFIHAIMRYSVRYLVHIQHKILKNLILQIRPCSLQIRFLTKE